MLEGIVVTKSSPAGYHYTQCGLDNVYLVNLPSAFDHAGHETITFPNINLLHACIRSEVALKASRLNGREIKFLRTELGLTQASLAKHLHKDAQTIGRWERGETEIDGASETLLRVLALEDGATVRASVRQLGELVTAGSKPRPYRIEASDPEHYRPAA